MNENIIISLIFSIILLLTSSVHHNPVYLLPHFVVLTQFPFFFSHDFYFEITRKQFLFLLTHLTCTELNCVWIYANSNTFIAFQFVLSKADLSYSRDFNSFQSYHAFQFISIKIMHEFQIDRKKPEKTRFKSKFDSSVPLN